MCNKDMFKTKLILLSICVIYIYLAFSAEGFYKDLFMDGGVGLNSRMTLPAADDLGLDYEYFADEDSASNNIIMVSNIKDDNGFLLYPDGSPRFKMVFVNGGNADVHGEVLGEEGRERFRTFYYNGGSYTGSCAGAILTTIHTNTWPDPDSNQNYYHIWPARSHFTQLENSYVDLKIPNDSPLLNYNYLNGDTVIEDVLHNGGVFVIEDDNYYWAEGSELLSTYDSCEIIGNDSDYIDFFGYGSTWAYKKSDQTGRIVVTGSHPESVDWGDQFALMKSIIHYALDGIGKPNLKDTLNLGNIRVMDDNSKKGYEKIGDKQYHHFATDIKNSSGALYVELKGDSGVDFNLYVNRDTFAFQSNSLYRDTGIGNNKVLNVPVTEGIWYIGVECASTIIEKKHSWGYTYEGNISLLNGIAYSILVDDRVVENTSMKSNKLNQIKITQNGSKVFINLSKSLEEKSIQLFDLCGRVVWEKNNIYADKIIIDKDITSGFYLLKISTSNNVSSLKITIF